MNSYLAAAMLRVERENFATRVLYLSLAHNGSETSGVRSTRRNAAKNGNPNSLHLLGLAQDVVFDTPADQVLALDTAIKLGLYFKVESDHVHFQCRPVRPRIDVA